MSAAPATFGLAVLAVLAFLLVMVSGQHEQAIVAGGFIPARVTLGTIDAPIFFVPAWATPLSATLIHGGLLHLVFNMVMLVFAGVATERAIGSRGVVILYLVGAYAAAGAQWLPDPQSTVPMIGASGAISALVGAYALLYGRQKAQDFGPIPGWLLHVLWLAVAWTVLNLAVGFVSAGTGMPIAAAAHIGGFLAGLALCRPLLLWKWRGA